MSDTTAKHNTTASASNKSTDPCHRLACDIQTCLQQSNYQERRCSVQIEAYNACVKENKPRK